jgi:hypothetical protein
MRVNPILLLVAALAVAGLAVASNAVAAAKEPTCSDLNSERIVLLQESKRLTSEVESKNLSLRETSDSLASAKPARKEELERRAEGLRRELTVLLDRELETTNRLGQLDSTIGKQCKKGGGK